jgi:hypothetical protein
MGREGLEEDYGWVGGEGRDDQEGGELGVWVRFTRVLISTRWFGQTLRLLGRVDANLVKLYFSRLLAALSSASSTASSSSSRPRQQHQARDRILSLLLEASSVVDTNGSAWADRGQEIVETASTRGGEVIDAVVVGTIDRFEYAGEELQAAFAGRLMEKGEWRKDGTIALLVAATVGGGSTTRVKREEAVLAVAQWLVNERGEFGLRGSTESVIDFVTLDVGETASDLLQALQEPFILSLLRLLSHLDTSAPSLSTLPSLLRRASDHSTLTTQPLFDLLFRCLTDGPAHQALLAAGTDSRSSTLPGFFSALQHYLTHPSTSTSSSAHSLPSSTPPQSLTRPLRYSAYELPTSPTRSLSGVSFADRDWDRDRERRERRGKEREREEKGGKGGVGESILGAGALALIGVEQGLDDDSDEHKVSSQGLISVSRLGTDKLLGRAEWR